MTRVHGGSRRRVRGAERDDGAPFRGYGGGRLASVARARGLVVVTPRTEAVLRNDAALADLIAGVRADHAFDEDRVLLLGHSMGAMTAMRRDRLSLAGRRRVRRGGGVAG